MKRELVGTAILAAALGVATASAFFLARGEPAASVMTSSTKEAGAPHPRSTGARRAPDAPEKTAQQSDGRDGLLEDVAAARAELDRARAELAQRELEIDRLKAEIEEAKPLAEMGRRFLDPENGSLNSDRAHVGAYTDFFGSMEEAIAAYDLQRRHRQLLGERPPTEAEIESALSSASIEKLRAILADAPRPARAGEKQQDLAYTKWFAERGLKLISQLDPLIRQHLFEWGEGAVPPSLRNHLQNSPR